MKMSWYYRILLSYAPIFFLVISVLIFSFFAVLNNSAQEQISWTEEAIATKVMQAVDNNLKAAERMVIKDIYMNEVLAPFFQENIDRTVYDFFLISRKLDDFSAMLPFSNSIYLYNEQTGKVLSRSGLSSLEQFGDRDFLLDAYRSGRNSSGWSSPRIFKEFSHEAGGERVVTLFKYFPFSGDKRGAVVVNVRVSALLGFIKDLTRYDTGLIQLYAENGASFDTYQPSQQSKAASPGERTPAVSDYTGWHYVSGAESDKKLSYLSLFHDFWIMVGLAAVIAGIAWFTYITHRNYKPIQAIAGRIHDYSKRRNEELVRHTTKDELKFIESAIDGLLERSSQYEQLYKDDLPVRKRQRLAEWLEGNTLMNEMQWKQEMRKLQLPSDFHSMLVSVMEIDRHSDFTAAYNPRDQYLLKFAVSQVLQEIAESMRVTLWNEWLEPHQMAAVFYMSDSDENERERAMDCMRQLQTWIDVNLEFTVSIGTGTETPFYSEANRSYDEARERLLHKPLFASNCFLEHKDSRPKGEGRIFPHLQLLSTLARSYRLDDGQWPVHLNKLAHCLQTGQFCQADLHQIMDYLLYQFHKEMTELPDEVQQLWADEALPQLEAISNHAISLTDWHERLSRVLAELEPRIRETRAVRNHHLLMNRVKQYIEMYYADPDLSLNKLSDHFELNPRYLSKLFKEEFGEKFIDYMLKVRLEEASRLLLQTELPVQEIAERVGYQHVISFHRAFKNMFGLPPGDYRKKSDSTRNTGE
ncbi:AraC family transcriptional regulator [Paenibacillus sp. H1-7]|uniref:AraC family transcriptional regulator n=1 Tax=Paenibacillus sp. H1-7 TaxID=2282849 RepID=UPI001EF99312|nr:AraC family transcriptional regulator [Paenibacillus sp. H1-7]ULL15344.1 AraC family transcriptional regulator [Paenibacillus sp. H1-7]